MYYSVFSVYNIKSKTNKNGYSPKDSDRPKAFFEFDRFVQKRIQFFQKVYFSNYFWRVLSAFKIQ